MAVVVGVNHERRYGAARTGAKQVQNKVQPAQAAAAAQHNEAKNGRDEGDHDGGNGKTLRGTEAVLAVGTARPERVGASVPGCGDALVLPSPDGEAGAVAEHVIRAQTELINRRADQNKEEGNELHDGVKHQSGTAGSVAHFLLNFSFFFFLLVYCRLLYFLSSAHTKGVLDDRRRVQNNKKRRYIRNYRIRRR